MKMRLVPPIEIEERRESEEANPAFSKITGA